MVKPIAQYSVSLEKREITVYFLLFQKNRDITQKYIKISNEIMISGVTGLISIRVGTKFYKEVEGNERL